VTPKSKKATKKVLAEERAEDKGGKHGDADGTGQVELNSTDTLVGYVHASLAPNVEGEVVVVEGIEYLYVRRGWDSRDEMTIIVEKRS